MGRLIRMEEYCQRLVERVCRQDRVEVVRKGNQRIGRLHRFVGYESHRGSRQCQQHRGGEGGEIAKSGREVAFHGGVLDKSG